MTLHGKSALVMGAGRNIGRAVALALAGQGADVAVHARASRDEVDAVAKEVVALGPRGLPVLGDLAERADVERVVHETVAAFGKVDILVNTPAIRPSQWFHEITDADWRRVIDVNLYGPFVACQAVLPGMVERRWGRIINFSGSGAFTGAQRRTHVMVTKTGILGLTRGLALEYAASGITVNTIVPGLFDTQRITAWHMGETASVAALPLPPNMARGNPVVGRHGLPQEIGTLCAYLASDAAAFITGQSLHINGGGYLG